MAKVTLVAPKGVTCMSVRGMTIDITAGEISVESEIARELLSHGFQPKNPAPVLSSMRSELVQLIMTPMRTVVEGVPDSALRDFITLSDVDRQAFWEKLRESITGYSASIASRGAVMADEAPSEKTPAPRAPTPKTPAV